MKLKKRNTGKSKQGLYQREQEQFVFYSDKYQRDYEKAIEDLKKEKIIERIWKKDYTVWSKKPDDIINRLGWLKSPGEMLSALKEITGFANSVLSSGIKHVLLLGMGGSSLAPEVFSLTFGKQKGYPDLYVLDSTDPAAILHFTKKLNVRETLYIVSTKSGGTVETFSFMKYFYNHAIKIVGREKAGEHFAAITDPGSGLESAAKQLKFRKIFLNDPDIGGRYSALSYFGIVPAAVIGIDIKKLLTRAEIMLCSCETTNEQLTIDNTAARLGVVIGELAKHGRDKLTFILPEKISSFGSWAEQLLAESTGKCGKGVVPVDGEEIIEPKYYSNDRLFVNINLKSCLSADRSKISNPACRQTGLKSEKINTLKKAGHPVIEITLNDIYDLGGEFIRWEMATAIAGWRMGIQPFDQPDVESAKAVARQMVKEYTEKGKLPKEKIAVEEKGMRIYGNVKKKNIKVALRDFFKNFKSGDKTGKGRSYIALQAYLFNERTTDNKLKELRVKIQKKYKTAATLGYGPRFLHSTGQLHKGDSGKGLFIQLLRDIPEDTAIPDNAGEEKASITFGLLKTAQASGDRKALINKKRKVITIELGKDKLKGIDELIKDI